MNTPLVLIRGASGSGKTTLAKEIARSCGYQHVENDMFFMHGDSYCYDQSRLGDAIRWCFETTKAHLRAGRSVVVSNCFIRRDTLTGFLRLAPATIIECMGRYPNVHGVPADKIARQLDNFEPYPGATILRS